MLMQTKLEDSNLYPNYIDRFCEYVFDGSDEITDVHEFVGYLKFFEDAKKDVWVKFGGDKYFDGDIYKVVDWDSKSQLVIYDAVDNDELINYKGNFSVTYHLDISKEPYINDGYIELSFKGLRFIIDLMDYDIELLNNALEQYYYDNF